MTGPAPARKKANRSVALALCAAALALVAAACGTDFYEIPIETPIQAKLDVSAFQRVLVAGFVAGGSEDVDANQETVRLLRSQLRTKSSLKVIDADIMPLVDIAQDQNRVANNDDATPPGASGAPSSTSASAATNGNSGASGSGDHVAARAVT